MVCLYWLQYSARGIKNGVGYEIFAIKVHASDIQTFRHLLSVLFAKRKLNAS
jgi:hypothetical protein